MIAHHNRRDFLVTSSVVGTGLLLACSKDEAARPTAASAATSATIPVSEGGAAEEPEVTATEDLMREHGVIRRALVVYREAAARLRTKATAVPHDALQKTARLLRTFAEDYHETQLEEAHIFPALERAGGPAARDVDVLIAQHHRGREITSYLTSITVKPIGQAQSDLVAATLEAFARMYEEHAALEDTIVFPAWKNTMSPKQLDEMGELFEDIEHKTFGKDGFDDAVHQIEEIEQAFGFQLAQFTAPPPPKV